MASIFQEQGGLAWRRVAAAQL